MKLILIFLIVINTNAIYQYKKYFSSRSCSGDFYGEVDIVEPGDCSGTLCTENEYSDTGSYSTICDQNPPTSESGYVTISSDDQCNGVLIPRFFLPPNVCISKYTSFGSETSYYFNCSSMIYTYYLKLCVDGIGTQSVLCGPTCAEAYTKDWISNGCVDNSETYSDDQNSTIVSDGTSKRSRQNLFVFVVFLEVYYIFLRL